jgi:hypothetical protein
VRAIVAGLGRVKRWRSRRAGSCPHAERWPRSLLPNDRGARRKRLQGSGSRTASPWEHRPKQMHGYVVVRIRWPQFELYMRLQKDAELMPPLMRRAIENALNAQAHA